MAVQRDTPLTPDARGHSSRLSAAPPIITGRRVLEAIITGRRALEAIITGR